MPAKEGYSKTNGVIQKGNPQIWRGQSRKFEACGLCREELSSKVLGDEGGNRMNRIMYSCPTLTSRCNRPPGPAAGTGSLPEIPGPRAVSGTAVAGAELKPEEEAEGVIWASGPQHSLPSDPTKIKLILTFTSSPKPCARDPFGLLRQVVW